MIKVQSANSYATSLAEYCTSNLPTAADSAQLKTLIRLISEAATTIRDQVSRAELVRELDGESLVGFAGEVLADKLRDCGLVGVLAINGRATEVMQEHAEARYAVVVEPLDRSADQNVNLSIGTIFSVFEKPEDSPKPDKNWVLQPGKKIVAAGYVLYGSSTMMVFTTGERVDGFTYDSENGQFALSHQNIRMPWQGKYYSTNDGYRQAFPEAYRHFFSELRSGDSGTHYSCRYTGALVADFHRTLLSGGVFAYPPTDDQPGGKLKLLFEVNPIAMLATVAGGVALDGVRNVLAIMPKYRDQPSTFVVGGGAEMEIFVRHARNPDALVYRTRMRVG